MMGYAQRLARHIAATLGISMFAMDGMVIHGRNVSIRLSWMSHNLWRLFAMWNGIQLLQDYLGSHRIESGRAHLLTYMVRMAG
jgi:hypothetical protein